MLNLKHLKIFTSVVEQGSFTSASNELSMPKSAVSRSISTLESYIGIRLLERSTRSLRLTEDGASYYKICQDFLSKIEKVHEDIIDRQKYPSGLLRISMPRFTNSGVFGELLAKFQVQYPLVTLEVVHSSNEVNLIQDKFDVGFYIGELSDSSMIARHIATYHPILCSSPKYLEGRNWMLSSLGDFANLNMVSTSIAASETIEFTSNNCQKKRIRIPISISVDYSESYVSAILNGAGLGILSSLDCENYFKSKELVPIDVEGWNLASKPVYMVYSNRDHLPLKVRKFIDFMIKEIDCNPLWR